MPYINNRGSKDSPIWIILDRPYGSDIPKGYLLSGGMGGVYTKMFQEAGLDLNSCFITCRRPNTDVPTAFQIVESEANQYQPPFLLAVNEVGNFYLDELKGRKDEDAYKGQLEKNAGSLLSTSSLRYPHYMLPVYGPDRAAADWTERNVSTYIDLGKLREELAYWRKYRTLQPLPQRTLLCHTMDTEEILATLDKMDGTEIIANDIENPIYKTELYKPHPGYPFLVGLASSPTFGMSFKLFRDTPAENRVLWRRLDKFMHEHVMLGQNFFNYDALFYDALGFRIRLDVVKDTLLRHHTLWPELSHKLQFLTRQYTREPYYKDEGHSWTLKYLDKYRRYNCLDCCITYEIYLGQEEEFKQRSHLR